MVIHRFDHPCVNRHPLGFIAPLISIECPPVAGGGHPDHCNVGRDYAQCSCAALARSPNRIPTFVVRAHVRINEGLWRLHGYVHRLKREVGKEGAPVLNLAINKLDGFIHQEPRRIKILGQLIRLTVCKPVGVVIERDIRPLLPVVGAGIGQCDRALKPPLARQQAGRAT